MLSNGSARAMFIPVMIASLWVLGIVAAAVPALAEPDFSAFTLHEEYWRADMVRFADGRVLPGTTAYLIEYQDRTHWQVTQVSHSFEPKVAGTRWTFDGVTLREYDPASGTTQMRPYPDRVDNWVHPVLMAALSRRPGAAVRDDASTGQRTVSWTEMGVDGKAGRTIAVFSLTTRLPVAIEDWVGSTLVRRISFTAPTR